MNLETFKKLLWVELITFDNSQKDMGVQAYLDNLGFIPDGISIFMWGSDFVHLHDSAQIDKEFPIDIGAYMDIYFEQAKKPGAPWTKLQLKTVINELHRHHVKVLFSIFPLTLNHKFHQEWALSHPELNYECIAAKQPQLMVINPLKRFDDGKFYEDFLLAKVCEVLDDYHFDGWHLADGYNHSWFQIFHADFSDDLLEQFMEFAPDVHFPQLSSPDERADYIRQNLEKEWIFFHRERFESYLQKIITRLHSIGKMVTSNTCWTRDPVEALYRYGMDYRSLSKLKFDSLVIETCGAMGELLDCACQAHFQTPFFNVIKGTALLTKACAPGEQFLFNCCTQDITEGWSTLKHVPGFLEREILCYSNLYIHHSGTIPKKCFDGFQICLADGIDAHEWSFVIKKADLGFNTIAKKVHGVALLWSNAMVDAELDYYLKTHNSLTANIFYKLLSAGLNCDMVVRVEDIDSLNMPVLVIHPALLEPHEQECLRQYQGGDVFKIDRIDDKIGLFLSSKNAPDTFHLQESLQPSQNSITPDTFFHELFYHELTEEFYQKAVKIINQNNQADIRIHPEFNRPDADSFRTVGLEMPDGNYRYFFYNVLWRYILGAFITDSEIKSVSAVNEFRGRPLYSEKRRDGKRGIHCELRVAPHGVGVVDIQKAEKTTN